MAAGSQLAAAFVSIGAELGQLTTGLGQAQSQVTNAVGNMQKTLGGLQGMFASLGIGLGFHSLISSVEGFIEKAEAAEDLQNRLNVAIEQTSAEAGFTGGKLAEMANALKLGSTLSGSEIKEMQIQLMRYRHLSVDTFERAGQAAVDMAAQGFGSAAGNASMLGRALDNPLHGMMMMRRMRIDLTDKEKEHIKELVRANRLQEAQGVILGRLDAQFGGVAAKMAATERGQEKQLERTIGEHKKAIGVAFQPLQARFLEMQVATWEALRDSAQSIAPIIMKVADAWSSLNKATAGWAGRSAVLIASIGIVGGLWHYFGGVLTNFVKPAIAAVSSSIVFLATNPIGWMIIAIGLATAAFFKFGDAGGKTASQLKATWQSATDAFQADDWELAVEVLFLQMEVMWFKVIDAMFGKLSWLLDYAQTGFHGLGVGLASTWGLATGKSDEYFKALRTGLDDYLDKANDGSTALQRAEAALADARARAAKAKEKADKEAQQRQQQVIGKGGKPSPIDTGNERSAPFMKFEELNKKIQEALLKDPVLEATEEGNAIMEGIAEDVAAIAGAGRAGGGTTAGVSPVAKTREEAEAMGFEVDAESGTTRKPLTQFEAAREEKRKAYEAAKKERASAAQTRKRAPEETETADEREARLARMAASERAIREAREVRAAPEDILEEVNAEGRPLTAAELIARRNAKIRAEREASETEEQRIAKYNRRAFVEAGPLPEKKTGYRQIKASGELTRNEQLGGITRGWAGPTQYSSGTDFSRDAAVQKRAEQIMQDAGGPLKMTFAQALENATAEARDKAIAEGTLTPNANDESRVAGAERRERIGQIGPQVASEVFNLLPEATLTAAANAFEGLASMMAPLAGLFEPGQEIPGMKYLNGPTSQDIGLTGAGDFLQNNENMEDDVRNGTSPIVTAIQELPAAIVSAMTGAIPIPVAGA